MKILLFLSPFIAIGIVYYIKTRMQDKHKPYVLGSLWILILIFASLLFTSIYNEIKFDEVKNARYQVVIKNLKDIRDTQLAHRTVKGVFQNNWDSLVKFVEIDSFIITQRRDSSVLDKEMTKRYGGVKTYKDIVIVDTLGFVSVKDSLFGFDNRYKTMMYVPFSKNDDTKFELKAGFLNQNGIDIPVFEALVKKRVILHDQSLNLILKENQVQSVDGVNGASLKIGSMDEVNTNGNWPKNYSKDK
ncbi:MAG: hypothetical protein ACJ0O7_05465 [Flavobacteriaceae bacterium]|jgi:hypothetical protein|tara:strand:- start:31809 stop:32543 length:735 start_codon:yes stop_codon:yes gene_type:complete